jgi:hemerythrin-like domain-containing protein
MNPRPTFTLHPVVEAKLARYMSDHPQETEHYRRMVRAYPDHAVKTIMCRKMIQHDEIRDLATRFQPLVKAWISETPGLHDRIIEKIQNVKPLYSNLAYVEESLSMKASRVSSPPGARIAAGVSIG